MKTDFTFVILTFNEEIHLLRLLDSIEGLQAPVFVLDSGSTDKTQEICERRSIPCAVHPFENHPLQWEYALQHFQITSPWTIGLDADQYLSPGLLEKLRHFQDHENIHLDGIYLDRKYYFRGKWIKYGGYYPKYQLRMFRTGIGFSDINEKLDHRFLVTGKTAIWKHAYLIEDNLKENQISFWLTKHNRYSDLLAEEEVERSIGRRRQIVDARIFGTPYQQNAWLKKQWWTLPLYVRPVLYYLFRMIAQRGILDGKKGLMFHFLQGFWFRLIVDIKINELLITTTSSSASITYEQKRRQFQFFILFPGLFIAFYAFHLMMIGITNPTGPYLAFADEHLNYIKVWREGNINASAAIARLLGYEVTTTPFGMHITGRAGFKMVYSCLGYGILSLFSAFVVAYPSVFVKKVKLLIIGIITFQVLNIVRQVAVSIYWHHAPVFVKTNMHGLFNYSIYLIMIVLVWSTYKPAETHGQQ